MIALLGQAILCLGLGILINPWVGLIVWAVLIGKAIADLG